MQSFSKLEHFFFSFLKNKVNSNHFMNKNMLHAVYTNSGDLDQMPHSVASNLGLHGQGPFLDTRHKLARIWRLFSPQIFYVCLFVHLFYLLIYLFVCVEVLRPSQPNWVMSSVVSLPYYTFIGQPRLSPLKWITSIVHILSPGTNNCPSWISGRARKTVENISQSICTKECCRPGGVEPTTS